MTDTILFPRIEIIRGLTVGNNHTITEKSWTIGRDQSCNLHIANERISRQHAQIRTEGGRWLIEDLGSTNGTFLNGIKLSAYEEKIVNDEDEIQIGKALVFRFRDPNKTKNETVSQLMKTGLWINENTSDVFVNMKKISPPLTASQYGFLLRLYQNPGKVFSLVEVIDLLWPGINKGITHMAINTQIHRINERLKAHDVNHDFIQSIRNQGRLFVQME